MDAATVKEKLTKVLDHIQRTTKGVAPKITGATRPLEDLEGFDSKVWPVAISMLSAELGVQLPNDQNIFGARRWRQAFTIDESIALVCRLIAAGKVPAGSAAAKGTQ